MTRQRLFVSVGFVPLTAHRGRELAARNLTVVSANKASQTAGGCVEHIFWIVIETIATFHIERICCNYDGVIMVLLIYSD